MRAIFPVVTYACGHSRRITASVVTRNCLTSPAPDFSRILCPICQDKVDEKRKTNPYYGRPINQPNDKGCKKCATWYEEATGDCWDCRSHDLWKPNPQP